MIGWTQVVLWVCIVLDRPYFLLTLSVDGNRGSKVWGIGTRYQISRVYSKLFLGVYRV